MRTKTEWMAQLSAARGWASGMEQHLGWDVLPSPTGHPALQIPGKRRRRGLAMTAHAKETDPLKRIVSIAFGSCTMVLTGIVASSPRQSFRMNNEIFQRGVS